MSVNPPVFVTTIDGYNPSFALCLAMRVSLEAVILLLSIISIALSLWAVTASRQARSRSGPSSFRAAEAQARELISAMADQMEKLSTWSARLAKRSAAATEQALEAARSHAPPARDVPPAPPDPRAFGGLPEAPAVAEETPEDRAAWKAQLRAGLRR